MDCTPVDDEKAERLLAAGATVSEVARVLNVSTQAIYRRIKLGRIARPERVA